MWKSKERKEPWHTARPLSKKWAKEEAREPWHKSKPGTKKWMIEEAKEHRVNKIKVIRRYN